MKLEQCLCCHNNDLFEILDLGEQPLANNYHTGEDQTSYELKLMGCSECWHTQLSYAVDPKLLFKHYLYVSGTSRTLKEYFDWFANKYTKTPGVVLEIACNDGTQLDSFKDLGWETWGVDPAENLHSSSTERGHNVICDFWNTYTARAAEIPQPDLIVAENVLAHGAHTDDFMEACKHVMKKDTVLLVQTSQTDMFTNNEFDTVYHEHISFFSVNSMRTLCERHGLTLNNVIKTAIHGNSYIFEISYDTRVRSGVKAYLLSEEPRYNKEFYTQFKANSLTCLEDFKNIVNEKRAAGFKVIGYGAAAKGMTVLNAGNISLDYIVDDNEMKQGRLCPGSNIEIHNTKMLATEKDNLVIVPLAWNFYEEITSRVKDIRPNNQDSFIKYFPILSVETIA